MENEALSTEAPKEDLQIQAAQEAPKKEESTKPTLRESLKKNLDAQASKEPRGTLTEPAKGDSFVSDKPRETILAPGDMSPEEKAAFQKLSPEMQKYVSRRGYETTSTFNRRMSELQAKEREVSELQSAVPPEIREEYARDGISVSDITRRAIAWDKAIKNDRLGAARQWLESYGIDPSELTNIEVEQPKYLTAEEAKQLAKEEWENNFKAQEQSRVTEERYNALQSFLDSKPIFKGDPGTAEMLQNAVAKEVSGLLAQGFQGSTSALLEESYKRAILLNDAFSSLRQNPEAARPDVNTAISKVQKAKTLSRTISGGPGQGSPVTKTNNQRENLRQRFLG